MRSPEAVQSPAGLGGFLHAVGQQLGHERSCSIQNPIVLLAPSAQCLLTTTLGFWQQLG